MATTMRVAGMSSKRCKCYGVSLPAFFRQPREPRPPRPPPPPPEPFPDRVGHYYRERNIGEEIRKARMASKLAPEDEGRPPLLEIPEGGFLPLWDLRDNPGALKKKRRVGRGIGSGRGKTCGRGHKGQSARSGNKPRLGFEGGQTPLRLRLPRKGVGNPFAPVFTNVNLAKVKEYIDSGKIDPSKLVTMKTLRDTGLSGKRLRDGIFLRARGAVTKFDVPVHLEVSRVTFGARKAIEEAGGSVRRVHYNKLGLKALVDPDWFTKKKRRLLPKPARPKPKIVKYVDDIGRLPAPDSPLLPDGFKLKAPVQGYPLPNQSSSSADSSTEKKD